MTAAVDFNAYQINKVFFERNFSENDEVSTTLSIDLGVEIMFNPDNKNELKADLKVNISGAITSEVIVSGFFTANEELKKLENEHALHIIAASILIPYVRSLISFISAADGNQPIIIPTVNLNNAFTDQEEN
ncbi:MAG: hypothetical protein GX328_05830 [Clostridiaceae bacterium]|nr:hypothetical protein [Clostridiaceae bacterium]